MGECVLGMRLFHLLRTSSVKNSEVFIGAYEVSYSNLTSFCGTAKRLLVGCTDDNSCTGKGRAAYILVQNQSYHPTVATDQSEAP